MKNVPIILGIIFGCFVLFAAAKEPIMQTLMPKGFNLEPGSARLKLAPTTKTIRLSTPNGIRLIDVEINENGQIIDVDAGKQKIGIDR